MATLFTLLEDLRARLNDVEDVQVGRPEKVRYINFGIAATFPSLYRVVRDSTVTLVAGAYEYDLPTTITEAARIFRVQVESPTVGLWWPVERYEVLPGAPVALAVPGLPGEAGARLRFFAAVPLSALSLDGDSYDGPLGTEEIPILYAMGCVAGRRVDDRIDHRRYSTVSGNNGVAVETIEGAAGFWFNQFEIALDKAAVPFPGS